MRTGKYPKFLLDSNPTLGRPKMGAEPNYPKPEFDLLLIADVVFHYLSVADEKVLRTIKFIKISFGQANKGPVSLIVIGEFEDEFRAARDVRVDIPLSNDEKKRLEALGKVSRLFCDDHQLLVQLAIDRTQADRVLWEQHALLPG